jgi:hypothetical protein
MYNFGETKLNTTKKKIGEEDGEMDQETRGLQSQCLAS